MRRLVLIFVGARAAAHRTLIYGFRRLGARRAGAVGAPLTQEHDWNFSVPFALLLMPIALQLDKALAKLMKRREKLLAILRVEKEWRALHVGNGGFRCVSTHRGYD